MTKVTYSPRHREIVTLIGRDGLSYKQVAAELGISAHTVVSHVEAIVARHRVNGSPKPRMILARLYWTELAPSEESTSQDSTS